MKYIFIFLGDTNSEFGEPIQLNQPIDYQLLYADAPTPLGMSAQQKIKKRNFGSLDVGVLEELDDDSELDEACTASGLSKDKFGSIVAAKELRHDARKLQIRMGHPTVRRVASFTSSPTKTELAKQQREQRRGFM